MTADELSEAAIASALAHAIRLGKRPPVGCVMGCNLQFEELDTATGERRNLSDKRPVEFFVTAERIAAAEKLINDQRQEFHRDPLLSLVKVGDPPPLSAKAREAIWRKKP